MENEIPEFTPPRRRIRRTGSRFLKVLMVAAVLILTVFFAWEYLVAVVSDVQFLTRQEVSRTTPLEGLLIKEESVIRSPANGKLQFTIQDGRRIEVRAAAAQVTAVEQDSGGAVIPVTTSVAGIVCHHLDGLESILSPANLDVLDLPIEEKIGFKPVSDGGRVEKGQPIFKIIDNLSPLLLYAELPKSGLPENPMDKPQWLSAVWKEQDLKIKPRKLIDRGDSWEGFFLLSDYPEQLIHLRNAVFTVTSMSLRGLLVSRDSIVMRDGEPGIFVVIKKKAVWTPVTVEGELEGKVAISGGKLGEDTRYVSNPLLAREGWLVE